MNYQLHDILSNPLLLNEVNDETLQKWLYDYPYVSLFHLYALKRKEKYEDSDLHKTAFYFNNREKLYFLLNNKYYETKTSILYENTNTRPPAIPKIEITEKNKIELSIENVEEEKAATTTQLEIVESKVIEDIETIKPPIETIVADEKIPIESEEITKATNEENIIPENSILEKELPIELKNKVEEVLPVVTSIIQDQPLSIADKIMLEIQEMKAERARQASKSILEEENLVVENKAEEENIIEQKENNTATPEIKSIEEITENKTIETEETIPVIEDNTIEEQTAKIETVTSIIETPNIEDTLPLTEETKTLSIQDEIIARIQKIKEEREHNQHQLEETTTELAKIDESEVKEIEVKKIATFDENTEEVKAEIIPIEEAETALIETVHSEIENPIEEKIELIDSIVSEIKVPIEKTISTKTEETQPLSIQDEIIARIQKIKEDRVRNQHQLEETPTTETEKTDSLEIEDTKEERPEIIAVAIEKNELAETKKVSVQEDIIASIQKIREDRANKLIEENRTSNQDANSITNTQHEEISAVENEEIQQESKSEISILDNEIEIEKPDIKIVDNTSRTIIPKVIEEEKNPFENLISISASDDQEKDIELIESKLQPELKKEQEDVDVLSTIHATDIIPKNIEQPNTETSILDILPKNENPEEVESDIIQTTTSTDETDNRFAEIYPQPLLVNVLDKNEKSIEVEKTLTIEPTKTEEIQKEKIESKEEEEKEVTIEKNISNEEITPAIKDISKEEIIEAKEVQIIEEPTTASIISKDSDLHVPTLTEIKEENTTIEEDKKPEIIEENELTAIASENTITKNTEVEPVTLDEKAIKEPHTFIEWLKLLDGNLQIQTTENPKENDNWIEIPAYEVQQTLANKKEIQKEEQKLFEPNFEEGEVDLFNEIDEEVSKVATDSVVFKQDMMTETLAKIYQKQGKTDKSLEIYNALRLKFPEKSAYFASLIEKIEKEK